MERCGMIGQWLAFFTCIIGLYIEIVYEADYGFVMITLGSLLFAAMTKIKHEGGNQDGYS